MDRVEPYSAVTLQYTMRSFLPDGSVKSRQGDTLEFIYMIEAQPPSLEKALEGARIGEKINLDIPPSEIFGEHDPELIREIPKKGLVKQRIKKGSYYRQMKEGCLVSFKVLEINPETVLADFNSPMADIRVNMDIEVTGLRTPSTAEIEKAREAENKRKIGCG